jgi:hypothetical protein
MDDAKIRERIKALIELCKAGQADEEQTSEVLQG